MGRLIFDRGLGRSRLSPDFLLHGYPFRKICPGGFYVIRLPDMPSAGRNYNFLRVFVKPRAPPDKRAVDDYMIFCERGNRHIGAGRNIINKNHFLEFFQSDILSGPIQIIRKHKEYRLSKLFLHIFSCADKVVNSYEIDIFVINVIAPANMDRNAVFLFADFFRDRRQRRPR